MKKCFINRNLWGYDKVQSPPSLGKEFTYIYITDEEEVGELSLTKGWDKYLLYTKFLFETKGLKRRKVIGGHLHSRIEDIFPELSEFDYVFTSDSNIEIFPEWYSDFVFSFIKSNKALGLSHGYYEGERNTLKVEYVAHTTQNRFKGMDDYWDFYKNKLHQNGVDIAKIPVYSAKYVGWKLSHSNYEVISTQIKNSLLQHRGGNIIFSIYSHLFYNDIYHFDESSYSKDTVKLVPHNYSK